MRKFTATCYTTSEHSSPRRRKRTPTCVKFCASSSVTAWHIYIFLPQSSMILGSFSNYLNSNTFFSPKLKIPLWLCRIMWYKNKFILYMYLFIYFPVMVYYSVSTTTNTPPPHTQFFRSSLTSVLIQRCFPYSVTQKALVHLGQAQHLTCHRQSVRITWMNPDSLFTHFINKDINRG